MGLHGRKGSSAAVRSPRSTPLESWDGTAAPFAIVQPRLSATPAQKTPQQNCALALQSLSDSIEFWRRFRLPVQYQQSAHPYRKLSKYSRMGIAAGLGRPSAPPTDDRRRVPGGPPTGRRAPFAWVRLQRYCPFALSPLPASLLLHENEPSDAHPSRYHRI